MLALKLCAAAAIVGGSAAVCWPSESPVNTNMPAGLLADIPKPKNLPYVDAIAYATNLLGEQPDHGFADHVRGVRTAIWNTQQAFVIITGPDSSQRTLEIRRMEKKAGVPTKQFTPQVAVSCVNGQFHLMQQMAVGYHVTILPRQLGVTSIDVWTTSNPAPTSLGDAESHRQVKITY